MRVFIVACFTVAVIALGAAAVRAGIIGDCLYRAQCPYPVIGQLDCGRASHYWAPPAQNRTGGIPASGFHPGF
jgi:hypothetical protein